MNTIALKLLMGVGITLTTTISLAADIPDSGRMLRESTPPAMAAPHREQPVILVPSEPVRATPGDSIKFLVTSFVFNGNKAFSTQELNRLMAPVFGKELNLRELEQAVANITHAYVSKGHFLATAIIPPQTIKPNQPIRVDILEGVLEGIELKTSPSETRVPRYLLERYRNRIEAGKPAEEINLIETSMLINELPALQSRIVLEPGKELGGTKGTLEVTEGKPYRIQFGADNYGAYSTGYYRVNSSLELFSPFRLGDRLTLRGQSSTSGDTQNAGVNWSVPVASYGATIALDYSWVRYELGRSFSSLNANGDAHGFNLMFTQPLVRRSYLVLNSFLAGDGKLLDDRIGTPDNTVNMKRRHLISGQAGLILSAEDTLLGGGSSTFSVSYDGGMVGFDDDAAKLLDQGVSGLQTQGNFSKISGGGSRDQVISGDLSLFAQLTGQWSNQNLDSSEQISLGGASAVRAYPVGEAGADIGMITSVELRYLLPTLMNLPGRLQLTGLFDYGYAELNAQPLPGSSSTIRHLYGAGFGVNWLESDLLTLRTSVSWLLGEAPTSDNTNGGKPTVYFQVGLKY